MLEGLEAIGWDQLKGAQGSGSQIPFLLRRVASGTLVERREAVNALRGHLWNNGQVFEATPHAVPFMAELLPQSPVAAETALLLGVIAESPMCGPPESVELAGKAREAVRSSLPVYLELLGRTEKETPLADALVFLIFHMHEDRETLVPVLRGVVRPDQQFIIDYGLARPNMGPESYLTWCILGTRALTAIEAES